MEFPNLGSHCAHRNCSKLDFLPMKCDACMGLFCQDHVTYAAHSCTSSFQKDVQVPVCPLCNQLVALKRGEPPDVRVSEHIDRDCQSHLAAERQQGKIFTNKCAAKGCKNRELMPIRCTACSRNFCLKHRLERDHDCSGGVANKAGGPPKDQTAAANVNHSSRSPVDITASSLIPSGLSESEQMALALEMSRAEIGNAAHASGGATAASSVHVASREDGSATAAQQLASDEALAKALATSEAEYFDQQPGSPSAAQLGRQGRTTGRRDNNCVIM